MENVVPKKKSQLAKSGENEFSIFLTESEKQKAMIEHRIAFNDRDTFDTGMKQQVSLIRGTRDGKWLGDFINRNTRLFRHELDEFDKSIKLLSQMKRLPQDFDLQGARVDFLINALKERLRSEANSIMRFHYAYEFNSAQEAKKALEKVSFSKINWQELAELILRQILTDRKDLHETAVKELTNAGQLNLEATPVKTEKLTD